MAEFIDAHQHFWDQSNTQFDYRWTQGKPPLDQSYLPADLQPLLRAAGINRSVFVQTQHNVEENRWVLKLAEQHDFIAGVVGWVDLASSDCESQLLEFKDHPKFVGIRHVTQDEPDPNWQVREDVVRGLKVLEKHNVPYDLLYFTQHLKHAATLAKQLPGLRMVIDHLSKPKIAQGPSHESYDPWRRELAEAAAFPNMYCKLSGMITEADPRNWRVEDLKPYVAHAIECFGFDRLMFGSDWPVCLLAGSYQQVVDALDEAVGPISESDRAKLWGGTAKAFYGL